MAASASPALKPPLAVKKKLMPLLLTSISSVIKVYLLLNWLEC
jgi:hypothetical protein